MRLVIADDSVLLREGLIRLLEEEGHQVVSAVGNADALLAEVAHHRPDATVVDVRMPPTHTDEGLRAALRLRADHPDVAVLVLSQYVEQRYAAELLAGSPAGVGYLLKDRVAQVGEFLEALDRVAGGGAAFDPEVVRRLLSRTTRTDPLSKLTPRELDVLKNMAQGLSNTAIAERLHVSLSAVEKHINAIFDKFGLAHTPESSRRVLAVLRFLST